MRDPDEIRRNGAWRAARDRIRETDEETLSDMVAATSIAAPSGAEAERAAWLCGRLRAAGLAPELDEVGNVIATAPCADASLPHIAVMAHLDTVFAADTPLDVQRSGERLTGPGISDNARGLAGMLALVRGLEAAGWPTRAPVVFIGSVGEEGAGDLRGAKHYVRMRGSAIGAFIALDGAGLDRIIHSAVGSRRMRVTFRGPGGHSWADWGAPNAIHAAGRGIATLTALDLPDSPRTTLTVGRIGGGTSVNTIPPEAWLEIDMRSESTPALERLEAVVRHALDAAAHEESGEGAAITCDVEVFGDRPAGVTPVDHELVRLAEAATRAVGSEPELTGSSTDANVAMAAGIPAIAIGAGGDAGGTHTMGEWYINRQGVEGIERALMVLLGAAGLHGG